MYRLPYPALALLLTLTACANSVSLSGEFATPVCASDSECEAMWNGARNWLLHNVPYDNLRIDNDERLVTHRGSDDPVLNATVEKVALPDGRYRIEANIRCGVVGACHPSSYDALKSFNRTVNRSYVSFD